METKLKEAHIERLERLKFESENRPNAIQGLTDEPTLGETAIRGLPVPKKSVLENLNSHSESD